MEQMSSHAASSRAAANFAALRGRRRFRDRRRAARRRAATSICGSRELLALHLAGVVFRRHGRRRGSSLGRGRSPTRISDPRHPPLRTGGLKVSEDLRSFHTTGDFQQTGAN